MLTLHFSEPMINCKFCNSNKLQHAYYAEYQNLKVKYDRCKECRSIVQNPPLSSETLNSIYNSDVYWDKSGNNNYIYTDYLGQREHYIYEGERRHHLIQTILAKQCLEKIYVLDIGCGPGFAALPFIKSGSIVTGIDPSKDMAGYAKEKFGLEVLVGMIEDELNLTPNSFDIIMTWGTSMNFLDPFAAYSKSWMLLKYGGGLFLDFFDMNGTFSFLTYRKRRKGIHVTCAPSKEGIKEVLARAGFSRIQFYRHYPYYSLSFIASQVDVALLKKLFSVPPFSELGVKVFLPGTYIVHAVKEREEVLS